MDSQTLLWIVNGLLLVISGIIGWFSRQLWEAVQALQKDLSSLEVKIAKEYVPYDRLQDAFKPIMDSLAEIKETLRNKADK